MSITMDGETAPAPRGTRALLGSLDAPLTVGALTENIKNCLESTFFEVVVTGEISNFKPHPSGHFYFNLKDTSANLTAVMFRQSNARLKFKPQDGLKVVAVGRISVYPPRGNYQIIITRLEPEGMGALQLAFEQLKKKLEALGYFNPERKRPIPKFPRTIGIVTASSGAAIRDILNILQRRFAGIRVLLYPVKVQGVGSAEEISTAIEHFNRCFVDVDVLIVGRGGGSIEDLWAFNEEMVASAIFHSKIPIISAVGHEVDFTIADFVADLRAPTPSAAAELVVANKWEVLKHVEHLTKRLIQNTARRLELAQLQVDDLSNRLRRTLEDKIHDLRFSLEQLNGRLSKLSPAVRLSEWKLRLSLQLERMKSVAKLLTSFNRQRLDKVQAQLRLLDPHTIMERGYSIVRNEKSKKVIRKASDVQMGDSLLIEFWKGRVRAKV